MNRELKNSESNLDKSVNKVHGFQIPEMYLNTVEDAVIAKISEQSFSKKNAFSTPNDYFQNFEDKLFSELTISKKPVKVISFRSRVLKFIPTAAAASVLLFIGLNYFTPSSNTTFDAISSDELDSWFDENYIDFNVNTSIDFVDADFTESNIIEDESSLEDEDILEYFNSMDNTSLLTEIES